VVYNDQVTTPNTAPRSYAYCADTIYDERLAEIAFEVTMIYHEATYLNGMEERASARFHSTTAQAATIASKANAGGLLLGHFSSKFEELHDYLKEALEIFPNTQLAIEGVTFRI
jgi:ribonuclease Z